MSAKPLPDRKPLSRRQFAEKLLAQEGRCGCRLLPTLHAVYADFPVCNRRLDASEGIVDEHLWPRAAGGSEEMSNRALLRKPCAKFKTEGPDAWLIKKTRHQEGGRGSQQIKRERRKERTGKASSIPSRPDGVPQGQKLQSGAKIKGGRRMETSKFPPKGSRPMGKRADPWGRG